MVSIMVSGEKMAERARKRAPALVQVMVSRSFSGWSSGESRLTQLAVAVLVVAVRKMAVRPRRIGWVRILEDEVACT